MSFILDALRKSDNERREQTAPPLAAAPKSVSQQKRNVWLPVLVIALAINAIVFGAFFLTRDEPAPVAVKTPPPPRIEVSEPEVRPLRKEISTESAQAKPSETAPADKPLTALVKPPQPATPVAAPEAAPKPRATVQDGLPSLDQLRASGIVQVGELRLDMHVYSTDPAKRLVFVNMKKYREGERLAEGPTIEEITPEGVILVERGNRFRLDRD